MLDGWTDVVRVGVWGIVIDAARCRELEGVYITMVFGDA